MTVLCIPVKISQKTRSWPLRWTNLDQSLFETDVLKIDA